MAKRYSVAVENNGEYELYVGQVWMDHNMADYRKITGISDRKGDRLLIKYQDNTDGVGEAMPEKQCDLDDFIIWILDTGRKPLVISYKKVDIE